MPGTRKAAWCGASRNAPAGRSFGAGGSERLRPNRDRTERNRPSITTLRRRRLRVGDDGPLEPLFADLFEDSFRLDLRRIVLEGDVVLEDVTIKHPDTRKL